MIGAILTAAMGYKANEDRKDAQELESQRQEIRASRERRKLANTARRNAAMAQVQGEKQGGLGTSTSTSMTNQYSQAGIGTSFLNQIQDYTARITAANNSASTWDSYGRIVTGIEGTIQSAAKAGVGG